MTTRMLQADPPCTRRSALDESVLQQHACSDCVGSHPGSCRIHSTPAGEADARSGETRERKKDPFAARADQMETRMARAQSSKSSCKIISRREANDHPNTVHRFFCSRYPFLPPLLSLIISSNLCDYIKPTIAVRQPLQRCAEPSKHARHRCPEPFRLPRATSSPTAP